MWPKYELKSSPICDPIAKMVVIKDFEVYYTGVNVKCEENSQD